jgi:hypothetical protein
MTNKDSEQTKEAASLKGQPVISFRAPPIVRKQLEALKAAWGENFTQVIHRAIASAYEKETGKRRG